MMNGLSFDVECYRQIHWRQFLNEDPPPSEDAERATHSVLDVLAERRTRATFFVVGNIARRFPSLVHRIHREGHEIGSHGDEHRDVRELGGWAFREELIRSRESLQALTGAAVVGHRAPMFSLREDMRFAFEVLSAQGFVYDSSIFPFKGPRYGDPKSQRGIHRLWNGVFEIPLTVVEAGGRTWPALGGGYFRTTPFPYSDWAMTERIRSGIPAVAYFHPWEFSRSWILPGPREVLMHPARAVSLAWYTLGRIPGRGASMLWKLDRLIARHKFVPLSELLRASEVFTSARPPARVEQVPFRVPA